MTKAEQARLTAWRCPPRPLLTDAAPALDPALCLWRWVRTWGLRNNSARLVCTKDQEKGNEKKRHGTTAPPTATQPLTHQKKLTVLNFNFCAQNAIRKSIKKSLNV